MASLFSTNPCKQGFQKVLEREFRLFDPKNHEKKMIKMGTFVKFRHLDPLKWPKMTRNLLYFLMTSSAMEEFFHFDILLKELALKITI